MKKIKTLITITGFVLSINIFAHAMEDKNDNDFTIFDNNTFAEDDSYSNNNETLEDDSKTVDIIKNNVKNMKLTLNRIFNSRKNKTPYGETFNNFKNVFINLIETIMLRLQTKSQFDKTELAQIEYDILIIFKTANLFHDVSKPKLRELFITQELPDEILNMDKELNLCELNCSIKKFLNRDNFNDKEQKLINILLLAWENLLELENLNISNKNDEQNKKYIKEHIVDLNYTSLEIIPSMYTKFKTQQFLEDKLLERIDVDIKEFKYLSNLKNEIMDIDNIKKMHYFLIDAFYKIKEYFNSQQFLKIINYEKETKIFEVIDKLRSFYDVLVEKYVILESDANKNIDLKIINEEINNLVVLQSKQLQNIFFNSPITQSQTSQFQIDLFIMNLWKQLINISYSNDENLNKEILTFKNEIIPSIEKSIQN